MHKLTLTNQSVFVKLLFQLTLIFLLIYVSIEYLISLPDLFYYIGEYAFFPVARLIVIMIIFLFFSTVIISSEVIDRNEKMIGGFLWTGNLIRKNFNIIIIIFTVLYIILFYIPLIFESQSTVIEGVRYWWLGDDAMISMRYAKNFADGNGLVWNIGERVEGYSNFLWTIIMGVVHFSGVPASDTSSYILLINGLFLLLTVAALLKLTDLLNAGLLTKFFSVGALLLNYNYLAWSKAGFETSLLALMIISALCLIIRDIKSNKLNLITFFAISAISLVRADAIIFCVLLFLIYFSFSLGKLRYFKYLIISLIIPISHLLFRIFYYGELLPNTAFLKVIGFENRIINGTDYFISFLESYLLFLVLLLLLIIFIKDNLLRLTAITIIIYNVYVIYIGGDAFENFRFFIPVIPIILILGFVVTERLPLYFITKIAISVLLLFNTPLLFPNYNNFSGPDHADIGNLEIGLLIKHNTPVETKVADFWAGTVFYFSERYGIDLLGKTDKHIARMQVSGGMVPGHNKYDFEYSLNKYKPDLVVANFKIPVEESSMVLKSLGNYVFTGKLFFSKSFQENYYNWPIDIETFRTIFIYKNSNLINSLNAWEY